LPLDCRWIAFDYYFMFDYLFLNDQNQKIKIKKLKHFGHI